MSRQHSLSTVLLFLAIGGAVNGQTVHDVPSQFATIQSAIVASANGNIVRVGPGTYLENINFLGKGITVRSTSGPAVTIIDAQNLASVVRMISNEPESAILDGFTIRNGRGLPPGIGGPTGVGVPLLSEAGGIEMRGASATIIRCLITQNTGGTGPIIFAGISGPTRAGAGGVHLSRNARLIDSIVSGNLGGSGASIQSTGLIFPQLPGHGAAGGVSTTFDAEAPLVMGCTIDGNTGGAAGFNATPNPNVSLSPYGIAGPGGAQFDSMVQTVVSVINTRITNNLAGAGDGTAAGGVSTARGYFSNCLVAGNYGGVAGIGALSGGGPGGASATSANFDHCTFARNTGGGSSATSLSCGAIRANATVQLSHAVLWGNVDALGSMSTIPTSIADRPTIVNSIVEGGATGQNIVVSDPLFVHATNGDFGLKPLSPAIDARPLPVAVFELMAHDLAASPRWIGTAPDFGAFEFGNYDAQKIGSNDDFAIFARPIGIGSPTALDKDIYGGMTLGVTLLSQGGTMANRYPVLVADLFSEGFPPIPVSNVFPELHWSANGFIAFDGTFTNQTMTPPPFQAYPIPFGLTGIVVRLQGAIYEPRAKNGFFAVTDAMDIHIR